MKTTQNAVFNLTGRQRILADQVRVNVDGERLHFHRLDGEGWAEHVDAALLGASILHIDIRSLFYQARESVPMSTGVLESGWEGLYIQLPGGKDRARYRLKAQVAVVLPADHADGGRILARSEELVVLEGDKGEETDEGGEGGSLLPTRPNPELDELCRLEIEHTGPKLLVNSSIDGLSWREIATQPYFKYAVITPCIEAVLLHIALADEDTDAWSEDWLALPGVEGLEDVIQEDHDVGTAYKNALFWAQECSRKVAVNRGVVDLFTKARKKEN
jgi:hypothetical protein